MTLEQMIRYQYKLYISTCNLDSLKKDQMYQTMYRQYVKFLNQLAEHIGIVCADNRDIPSDAKKTVEGYKKNVKKRKPYVFKSGYAVSASDCGAEAAGNQ